MGSFTPVRWESRDESGRNVREWTGRDTIEVTCKNCGLRRHDPDASHCKACGHVIYQEYESRE